MIIFHNSLEVAVILVHEPTLFDKVVVMSYFRALKFGKFYQRFSKSTLKIVDKVNTTQHFKKLS